MSDKNRADCCGKFRKIQELVCLEGEGSEQWVECCYCCSDFDYDTYFKKNLGDKNER